MTTKKKQVKLLKKLDTRAKKTKTKKVRGDSILGDTFGALPTSSGWRETKLAQKS